MNEAGLNSFDIVENLSELGVDTVEIDIEFQKQKEMSNWSKEEWANSWKGDILTDDGSEIISDEELSIKVSGLEKNLNENSISILEKQENINKLKEKFDQLIKLPI